MPLAQQLTTLRLARGLSARQLAQLLGVAPTTITRIESGAVSPSFALAQAMFEVLGEPIGFNGRVSPDVISAARWSRDPALPIPLTDHVRTWLQRWSRLGLVDDLGHALSGPTIVLEQAAISAPLSRRAGRVDYVCADSAHVIAARLQSANIDYALTGDAAVADYCPGVVPVWPIFYVADLSLAAQAAGLTRQVLPEISHRSSSHLETVTDGIQDLPGKVTLIPFDGICELGRECFDQLWVATPDQVALDCYAGEGGLVKWGDVVLGRDWRSQIFNG